MFTGNVKKMRLLYLVILQDTNYVQLVRGWIKGWMFGMERNVGFG